MGANLKKKEKDTTTISFLYIYKKDVYNTTTKHIISGRTRMQGEFTKERQEREKKEINDAKIKKRKEITK